MNGREGGFTLIELLASLTVLTLTAMLIAGGVGSGRKVWETVGAGAAAGEAVEGAQGALRERLERAFPATLYDASAPYVDFQGDAESVEFLAQASQAEGPQPLRRYRLELSPSGDLALTSRSDVAADPAQAAGNRQVLLHGVQSVDIAYFGVAAPDSAEAWRTRWRQQPATPELVRIRVSFPAGDRRSWPELIVKPQADVDFDCVLDRSRGTCRGRA